jgi:hypothetical protein
MTRRASPAIYFEGRCAGSGSRSRPARVAGDLGLSSYSFDVEAIRRDFPILRELSTDTR